MRWLVDGTNVMGSRPDGWWNDRPAAAARLTQEIARWCRTHRDDVVVVFDRPAGRETLQLAGGNLEVVEATRRGRDAADDDLVALAEEEVGSAGDDGPGVRVVTSDRGLRRRLPDGVEVMGSRRFLDVLAEDGVD